MSQSDPSAWATVISALSAVAAVAAAGAAIWSAKAARDAAKQSAQQAHQTLLRDLSQSVTTVISRGERVQALVLKLKVERQTLCGLNGRNVAAAAPLIQDEEEKAALAEQMKAEARALEERLPQAEEELQAYARNMGSYATRLGIMEAHLAGELDRVEADNRAALARRRQPFEPR
jgi:hypothetical protein